MKNKIMMAAILSSVVFAAGAAQAENHRERPDFSTLDLDGSGGLTLQELQAQAELRFAALDADGDGGVSVEELIAAADARAAERAAKMVERLDENGDGILQMEEMPRRGGAGGDRAERMFEHIDANDDGEISEEEFEQAREKRGDRRGDGRHSRG